MAGVSLVHQDTYLLSLSVWLSQNQITTVLLILLRALHLYTLRKTTKVSQTILDRIGRRDEHGSEKLVMIKVPGMPEPLRTLNSNACSQVVEGTLCAKHRYCT